MELAVGLGPGASDVTAASWKDVQDELYFAGAVFGTFNPNIFHLLTPFAAATAYRADPRRSTTSAR